MQLMNQFTHVLDASKGIEYIIVAAYRVKLLGSPVAWMHPYHFQCTSKMKPL